MGVANRLGSANGCLSALNPSLCTPDQLAGIGVSNWTVNSDNSYALDYSWVNSGVAGFIQRFRLHLAGNIVTMPDIPVISGVWSTEKTNPTIRNLFIFGDNFATSVGGNQVTVNGTLATILVVLDQTLLVVSNYPPEIKAPFTVTVTTPAGTGVFPKPCN
jgi:hypothetical protein